MRFLLSNMRPPAAHSQLGGVLLACLAVANFSPAAEKIQYNRDIRPILAENCFACHGPDSASRKANLRLDKREVAIEAGAISPGKPDESELVKRIRSDEATERMPPAKDEQEPYRRTEETARGLDRLGSGLSAALVVHRARASAPPGCEEQRLGAQPDRPFHPVQARSGRLEPGAGGRPAHAGPARLPRPDRPAA